ncbi:MAG: hypothetical protein O7B99_06585 [Planctomycetota bacterium]|nr:hypothetical protein [Planctomycetota bacterium]
MRYRTIAFILLAGSALAALPDNKQIGEKDDHPRGANSIEHYGGSQIAYDLDIDFWRLERDWGGPTSIQVQTGVGLICGCPKGLPFPPWVVVYQKDGTIIGYALPTSGDFAQIDLPFLAADEPIWIEVTGFLTDPLDPGWYTVSIY